MFNKCDFLMVFCAYTVQFSQNSSLHPVPHKFNCFNVNHRQSLVWRVLQKLLLQFVVFQKWYFFNVNLNAFFLHILDFKFSSIAHYFGYVQIIESINKCDVDIRRELFSTILVTLTTPPPLLSEFKGN